LGLLDETERKRRKSGCSWLDVSGKEGRSFSVSPLTSGMSFMRLDLNIPESGSRD